MRWLTPIVVLALLQPQTTFRTSVHLIVQPVSVKDKNGRPVLGLTAKDFVLTEDGKPQEIAFVEYEPLDGASVTPVAAAPPSGVPAVPPVTGESGVITPAADSRYRGRRLLILYFDAYGMALNDQYRALSSAARYIDASMMPADLVAIMTFKGRVVRLVQAFTDDRAALAAAIQQLTEDADEQSSDLFISWDPGSAFGEDDDTFNLFTADRQLAALQTAMTGLGGLPEIKTLVYFGGGLKLTGTENLAQLRATINAAIRANVTLNPIDSRGLVASAPLGDATRPSPGGVGMFS
ncbi:MAG TPA: VWA domain-containing protein, partial [Vicinamibacterales bacterium]